MHKAAAYKRMAPQPYAAPQRVRAGSHTQASCNAAQG